MTVLQEALRLAQIVSMTWLCIQLWVIARVVKNARQFGCYMGIAMAGGYIVGNIQHFHQTLGYGTPLPWVGFICGLIYVAKVKGEPAWQERKAEQQRAKAARRAQNARGHHQGGTA